MNAKHSYLGYAALALFASGAVHSQPRTENADPKFEVASIKAAPAQNFDNSIRRLTGGIRLEASGVTLKRLVEFAYNVASDQVTGGPQWVDRDKFNLEAKAERASSMPELQAMLRSLLAERFRLQVRRTVKEAQVYVLTVDRGGVKMTRHDPQNAGDTYLETKLPAPLHIKMTATAAPIAYFALRLRPFVDRPVVDRTGLTGWFDFTVAFTMEPPPGMRERAPDHQGNPVDFSGPTIFQAARRELGLQMDSAKEPIEAFAIERAEALAEN